MRDRHVFAIGDNGFRSDPDTLALYRYILKTTGKEKAKVCLIPTASGDAQDYMDVFDRVFKKLGCEVTHLSLFRGENPDFEKLLMSQDLIYVSGGNTRNMLVLWKEWGIDVILRKAYEHGIVLAGGSAGSLCWFEGGVTDSVPGRFSSMQCLGYLNFSNCPHYNELTRRPYYLGAVGSGELTAGYATENGVALHFVNETLRDAISPYNDRKAYFVKSINIKAGAVESALEVRFLP
ncbi:MAG: peptidase E [Bdellovibrionales bacterium]|nr:peptidase E [Oligoflexia bacterium]